MPLKLHVIRASEFVRLDADENLDLEATKEVLRTLAQACHKRGSDPALVDLRQRPIPAQRQFTPSDLAALIQTVHEAGFARHQRLAVLYRSDPHHGVRTFAFIGRMRGMQVQAFEHYEEALLWLSGEPEKQTEFGQTETEVPIANREAEAARPHYTKGQ